MSVSMWSYRPEVCDGGGCPGDCDLCDKPKNMEDELTNSTQRVKRRVKNELNAMTDYIKRSDAIRAMAQYMMDTALIDNPEASDRIEQWEGNIAAPVMSVVNAADVVAVVRCKDCKHYNEYENGEKIIDEEEVHDGWCMRWSGIENVNRHDYCSYGERRE